MKSSCGLFTCGHSSQIDFNVSVIARSFQHAGCVFRRCLYFKFKNLIERTALKKKVTWAVGTYVDKERIICQATLGNWEPPLSNFSVEKASTEFKILCLIRLNQSDIRPGLTVCTYKSNQHT